MRHARAWKLANLLGAIVLLMAGCATPPPEIYTRTTHAEVSSPALDIGMDAAAEACSLQRGGDPAAIYCGTSLATAGHVAIEPAATDPTVFLTASPWLTAFGRRFQCGPPRETLVLDVPAVAIDCVRRQFAFPQVAIATRIDGKLYVADGVKSAEPALGRAIGVMAGRLPAVAATGPSDATGIATQRAAAQAMDANGADAIAEVENQIARGAKENREGNYAAAEAAYRAAATLLERAIGRDSPALAVPLATLAIQISDQGRFSESDRLFERANRLVALPSQPDPVAVPTVAYLEGLDSLNKHQPAQALGLLAKAAHGFSVNVPADLLVPRPAAQTAVQRMAGGVSDAAVLKDETSSASLHGLIETERYEAVALVQLDRPADAAAALASARNLYEGRDPRLVARYYRTVGMTAAAAGNESEAGNDLDRAVGFFARAQPDSQPLAKTQLLRAGELAGSGDDGPAVTLCRQAAQTLQALKAGADPSLVVPCLHVMFAQDGRGPNAQATATVMFSISQLAQSSTTSRQIALATERLAEGSRDPRIAEAIRQGDLTTDRLDALYRKRAVLAADSNTDRSELAAVDDDIRKAREAQTEAGEALQAAAPGFGALVQETVDARDVQALLGPKEVFVSIVLAEDEGWVFLLRKDRIVVGRIEGGTKRVNPLVARFRASMEQRPNGEPPPFDIAAAQDLYTAVLGPVAGAMGDAEAISVAPSGSLLSIPFGALLTGPASPDAYAAAPFLIRKFAVSHVPSAASFVNLRKSAKTAQAPQPWFGMGEFRPPTLRQATASFPPASCGTSARDMANLAPLPGARNELEAARSLLGASANDEMLGAAFTAKNVRGAPLSGFRVLHFATHAVLPGELKCQDEPAIITSTPNGAPDASGALLTASQVAQLDLNAELVILAACNTGGPIEAGAGESLSGLARSFFFAGARSLLVTHWDANDAATTYVTAVFLATLGDNPAAGPASALAVAQRRMLDRAVGVKEVQGHPYYWAAVALIGGRGASGSGIVAEAVRRSVGG